MSKLKFGNLVKKRNLAAIPLILIPEYGQSNATLVEVYENIKGLHFQLVIVLRSVGCYTRARGIMTAE